MPRLVAYSLTDTVGRYLLVDVSTITPLVDLLVGDVIGCGREPEAEPPTDTPNDDARANRDNGRAFVICRDPTWSEQLGTWVPIERVRDVESCDRLGAHSVY